MRLVISLVGLLALLSPFAALACTATDCAAGNYCATDARISGGSACYRECRSASGGSGGCTGTDRCVSVTGHEVCVPASSPLATGSGTTLPSCATGRTCPTDHTYICVSDQCHLVDGQPCTDAAQCKSGSTCSAPPAGSGNVCTASSVPVSGSTAVAETPYIPIVPKLGVQIPGLELSPSTKDGDIVAVSYIGEYVNAVYRYMVGIVLIVAIVMVVYGGFRYLVGASLGDIKSGKTIITDALIGMLLVLGAYMLLNTINPATLNLSAVRLQFVNRIDFEADSLATTAVTIDEEGATPPGGSSFTSCPVSLSTPASEPPRANEPRTSEFQSDVLSIATGPTVRNRIIQIAEAAAVCGVRFNSCGKTVENISTVAGGAARGRQTHSISGESMAYLDTVNCDTGTPRSCKTEGKRAAYARLRDEIPGWPDVWANELQPGDAITVFNANSSQWGTHRAFFMGWASGGNARVVQGGWTSFVNEGTICIKSSCSNPTPLVRTFVPNP